MDELNKRPEAPRVGVEKQAKVTVEVNKHPVTLKESRVTGVSIKQAAVDQQVPHVLIDFLLMRVTSKGAVEAVADSQIVTVNKNSKFKMVAADDNS